MILSNAKYHIQYKLRIEQNNWLDIIQENSVFFPGLQKIDFARTKILTTFISHHFFSVLTLKTIKDRCEYISHQGRYNVGPYISAAQYIHCMLPLKICIHFLFFFFSASCHDLSNRRRFNIANTSTSKCERFFILVFFVIHVYFVQRYGSITHWAKDNRETCFSCLYGSQIHVIISPHWLTFTTYQTKWVSIKLWYPYHIGLLQISWFSCRRHVIS